jgi:hypothetical protein
MNPPASPILIAGLLLVGMLALLEAEGRLGINHRQKRKWLHILSFALMTVITVYVILDIEYPRTGLIRLEGPDKPLLNIRDRMK